MSIPDYTITELNLACGCLNKLPDDIHKYTNLTILDCRSNNLTSLDNLPINLQKLYCSSNQFKYDFEPTLENIKKYNVSRIQ